jgi:hypothetical protein
MLLMYNRGARYLTGENLKVVWAEYSKLGRIAILRSKCIACMLPLLELKTRPRVRPVG